LVLHTVVSAFRASVTHETPHSHLVGISAVRQTTGEELAWTASDLAKYPDAVFLDGTQPVKPRISVTRGTCNICGEEVVRLVPADLEQRLPEAAHSQPSSRR